MHQATLKKPEKFCTDHGSKSLPTGEHGLEISWLCQELISRPFFRKLHNPDLTPPRQATSLWLPFASKNLSSPFPSLALVLRGRQVETILAPLFGCYSATRRVSTPPGSKATAPVKGWLRITDAFLINPHPLELQRWPQKGRDPHTTSGSVSLRELSRDRCLVKREGPGAGNRKGNRERN